MLRWCEGLGGGLWGLLQHDLDLSTELSNKDFLKLMKLSETLHGDQFTLSTHLIKPYYIFLLLLLLLFLNSDWSSITLHLAIITLLEVITTGAPNLKMF